MKFENPIMNISMFEVENVVTVSGEDTPTGYTGEKKTVADLKAATQGSATNVLAFEF